MADEADLAFETEQQSLNAALEAQRRASAAPKATGTCHYCGEHLNDPTHLFCDIECAKEWEDERALRRRQGLTVH